MITCSRKIPLKRAGHTWAILFFVISYCPMLWGQTSVVSLGDDFIVGEEETITLHAELALPGMMPPGSSSLLSESYSLAWFERTIDESEYPGEPFATGTETDITVANPEESTYYKVVLTDAVGVSCEDEVLAVRAKLKKVLFLNTLPLCKDPDVTDPGPVFLVPEVPTLPQNWHWEAGGTAKPVWYAKGQTLVVSALLQLKGINSAALANLKIKTTGSTGFSLTTTVAGLESTSTPDEHLYVSTSTMVADVPFPDNIAVFNEFTLNWKFSKDNGVTWKDLANSGNACYISRQPLEELIGQFYFHTTVHLSCTAAQGLVDEQEIVNNIYQIFTTKEVKRYGSANAMNYWGNATLNNFDTFSLLKMGTGKCGAWARFFTDMLSVQGISSELKSMTRSLPPATILEGTSLTNLQTALTNTANAGNITFDSSVTLANGCFLVKNWTVQPDHFYIRLSAIGNPIDFYSEYVGTVITNVATDGSPAQSNGNPRSRFYDHLIVKCSDFYYDPSYGSYKPVPGTDVYDTNIPPFSSVLDWEQYSLDAMGATFGFNGDEILWIENSNPNSIDLIENNNTY